MRNYITMLLVTCSLLATNVYAYDVMFGESETTGKRSTIIILGKLHGKVCVYKFKSMPMGVEKHSIIVYNPSTMASEAEVEIDLKIKDFEGIDIINNNIVVFLNETNKSDNYQRIYYNVYDGKSIKLKSSNNEIARFELVKGQLIKRSGSFRVLKSKDESKFGIYYNLPYQKGEKEKFGISVYDNDFEKLSEEEFSLPLDDEMTILSLPFISNNGDFYIAASEAADKTVFGRPSNFSEHIYQVNDGELVHYDVKLPGKFIYEYTYDVDPDDNLVCSGFYGEDESRGVSGCFYIKIDGDKSEIIEENYQDFSENFITAGWSDKEKKKAEKKKKKGKGDPVFYSYDISEMFTLSDGSAIMVAEQFYIKVRTYTDSKGNTRTVYYYYYNDIIVTKINSTGEFEWYSKIPKYQVSTNDGGFYSSYSFHYNDESLFFMFNDNIKNYEEGNVVGGKTYPTNFKSNKDNVTSLVTMSVEEGTHTKQKLFSKAELKTIAVPKTHLSDRDDNILYIYSRKGKQERLGRIQF